MSDKMNKEMKQKWVDALRSGKYKQGSGVLRQPDLSNGNDKQDKFCCLGVLCDLHDPSLWKEDIDTNRFTYLEMEALLPTPLLYKYGLNRADAEDLMIKNDKGVPFTKIANDIEREL